jgi:hypothetical protein
MKIWHFGCYVVGVVDGECRCLVSVFEDNHGSFHVVVIGISCQVMNDNDRCLGRS